MMLPILQIEQKEIETLEIELKEKVASLARIKKEFDEMQVPYLVLQINGSQGSKLWPIWSHLRLNFLFCD